MKKRRLIIVLGLLTLMAFGVCGCGSESTDESEIIEEDASEAADESEVIEDDESEVVDEPEVTEEDTREEADEAEVTETTGESNEGIGESTNSNLTNYKIMEYYDGTQIEILNDTELYEEPSTASGKIRSLEIGTLLTATGDVQHKDGTFASWVRAEIDGKEGFVYMQDAEYVVGDVAPDDFEVPEGMYGGEIDLEQLLNDIENGGGE